MRFSITIYLCAISFVLSAQTSPTSESIRANLDVLANNFTQERIYIHFDKPVYAPGETIWFKAYLMAATDLSNISKTLYVDFRDAQGNLLMHGVEPIIEGSAKGHFIISDTFKSKSVHVIAYTRWMLNFDSSFLYHKAVRIVSSAEKNQSFKDEISLKKAVQFFPEGGTLVAGLKTKVAFKATDNRGKPFTIHGNIVNNKSEKVADITCIHDGMGYFYLQPEAGETYTAKWKDESGANNSTALPLPENSGVTMEIKPAKDSRGFFIQRSENTRDELKKLYIVATMQQHLVYMAGISLEETAVTGGAIPTNQLPSGILQITLFDSNWVAIAERITFINNHNYQYEPEVGFAALGTQKRERNILVISLADTVTSNISVAVTDAGIGIDSSNIISGLLLTSDLRGSINNPLYYFSNNSDSLQQKLDLVMLTNGWRRIHWEDVASNTLPEINYTNDTAYLNLSGKIYGLTPQDVRQGTILMMIIENEKDTGRLVQHVLPDESGLFSLPDLIFTDTLKVYYQLAGSSNAAAVSEVSFDNGLLKAQSKIKNENIFLNDEFSDSAIENRNKWFAKEQARLAKIRAGTTLQEVIVKAKSKSGIEILNERYTSGLFSNGDAVQFDIVNDPLAKSAMSIFSFLQGRVAGLSVTQQSGAGGSASVSWRGGSPEFFLNESPVESSTLSNINMSEVAYIKVFRPPFTGSFNGGNGAIAIYTRKGADISVPQGKGLPYKMVIGYTPEKEFYSPNYATFTERNEQQDLRSTLYWNPMVFTTTENHVIKLPFYNNDVTNSFRVIVEGVTKEGKFIHVEKVIE